MVAFATRQNESAKWAILPRADALAGEEKSATDSFWSDDDDSITVSGLSTHELHGFYDQVQSEVASVDQSNQQYSILALTDSSGNVSERYAYTAYGQPTFLNASATVQSGSAAGNRYTYTAREWDATLGLHHFRARWMSGLTGRFLTRDPIRYRGSKWNLYELVNSQPLRRVDPFGLEGASYVSCCGGKLIHSGGGNTSGCCNNVIYDYSSDCCESGVIVPKVSVWKCVLSSPLGASCDYTAGWVTCPFGWRFRHSFVCLDGPNENCFGADKRGIWGPFDPEDPWGYGDEGYTKICNENKVCPSEKTKFGTTKFANYNFFYNNCHHQAGNCSNVFW